MMIFLFNGVKMYLKDLSEPFPEDDIEWRVGMSGESRGRIWAIVLPYVTNRAIQDRLDNVVGAHNWQNAYVVLPGFEGILCGLSIRIENQWITKYDGAEKTDIEPVKGALSNSMKRAAVQWGIGRYLYNLPLNQFAIVRENGRYTSKIKDKKYRWDPPSLPEWAKGVE